MVYCQPGLCNPLPGHPLSAGKREFLQPVANGRRPRSFPTGDDATKLTSPSGHSDLKLWGGVSIGWARALGQGPREGAE